MAERESGDSLLLFKTGLILSAVAFAFGYMRMRQAGQVPGSSMVVALAMPASATLLYLMAGILVPGLFATQRMRFPLFLTLPVVYATLLVLSVILWTSQGSSLFAIPNALRSAGFWLETRVIFGVMTSQVISLVALAWLEYRMPAAETPEEPS